MGLLPFWPRSLSFLPLSLSFSLLSAIGPPPLVAPPPFPTSPLPDLPDRVGAGWVHVQTLKLDTFNFVDCWTNIKSCENCYFHFFSDPISLLSLFVIFASVLFLIHLDPFFHLLKHFRIRFWFRKENCICKNISRFGDNTKETL